MNPPSPFLLPSPPDAPPLPSALVGIARLAADAPSLQERHHAGFFALPARTLLTPCTSRRFPFSWSLNPYRGCEFGCHYCYARYTHEFMELRQPEDFERFIFVKQQAAAVLRRDLRRVHEGESIAIGTATDPYQPAERRFEVTRSLLEVLSAARGLDLNLITKSDLITRDIDLLQRVARSNRLIVRMTVTTADTALARLLEPRAPRPDLRFAAVRQLAAAGLNAGVHCAPVLPGITDSESSMDAVACAAADSGARFLGGGLVFLQPCAQARFLPFLERAFPALAASYRRHFAHSPYLPEVAHQRLQNRIERIRARYGLALEPRVTRAEPRSLQLPLF